MKRLHEYWSSKTTKQKIYLIILLFLILTFAFFMIKGNIFDKSHAQTDTSMSTETTETTESITDPIEFHINLWDVGILLVVVIAYLIHKYRDKKSNKR